MFHPLAYTKTFALCAVALLAVTLVPALCTIFIRGKLRSEQENPLIRGVIEVYRPVLSYMMDRPAALAWVLGVTFLLGFIPLGSRAATLAILFVAMVVLRRLLARRWVWAVVLPASLVIVALVADQTMTPLAREFMTPLDEGMVMDMPITVPRASVTESVDDLKARDMVLCRFPEVDMVVGKAGRAETATDPAPMDMIETMVNFRPQELWPRRKLGLAEARRQGQRGPRCARRPASDRSAGRRAARRDELIEQSVAAALVLFDAASREYAYHRYQEMLRETGGISPSSMHPSSTEEARYVKPWQRHVEEVDRELLARAAPQFTRLLIEQLIDRGKIVNAASLGLSHRSGAGARQRVSRREEPYAIGGRAGRASSREQGSDGFDAALRAAADPGPDPANALAAIQPPAHALEGRSGRAGCVWRRARHGRFHAGLDERLDDADPESCRHAFNRS